MKYIKSTLRYLSYWLLFKIDQILSRENPASILIFPSISHAQLEVYIKAFSRHYQFISLSQMVDVIEKKQSYLKPVISITFDEGYRNIISIAPVFAEYGIKPTIFVLPNLLNTNHVEFGTNNGLLSDTELILLNKKYGWEVGSNLDTNLNLTSFKPKKLQKFIHDSKKILSKKLDTEVHFFAYPHQIYSDEIISHVKKAGYKAAFTRDHQKISLLGNLYRIPRVHIPHTHTPMEAAASFSPSVIMVKSFIGKFINI